MSITILEKSSNRILAKGDDGEKAHKYEGNWYFDPAAVDNAHLVVTDRTYTCPVKGTCNWVDFVDPEGKTVKDVAWLYPKPKAGHETIAGRYGFYAGTKGGTRQEG